MKKFNLEKARNGNIVITKEGKEAKILLFDRDSKDFPLVVIVENKKVIMMTKEGKYYTDKESEFDLKMKN